MKPEYYIIIVLAVLLVVSLIITFILAYKNKKNKDASKVKIKDGVRYTYNENSKENVTFFQGDKTLSRGKTYIVKKDTLVIPGKYVMYSVNGDPSFNVRIGTFVREYQHGANIVLAEGETITPVSHDIILR